MLGCFADDRDTTSRKNFESYLFTRSKMPSKNVPFCEKRPKITKIRDKMPFDANVEDKIKRKYENNRQNI